MSLSADTLIADGSATVSCYMVMTDFLRNPIGDMGGECISLAIAVNGVATGLDTNMVTIGDTSSGYAQDATVYWTPAGGTSGSHTFTISMLGTCIGYSSDFVWDTGNIVTVS